MLKEDEILPVMEEEFPFIHLSPHTAKLMWQKQMRQVDTLCKAARVYKPSKAQQKIEDAQKRQRALTRIMKKELEHNQRLVSSDDITMMSGGRGSLLSDEIFFLLIEL